MGDRHHGAGEALQELLEPLDGLGVQVVGRLVEQQHVGLAQQQAAQRDAALLAAREHADLRVPRRQAQRVGGQLELQVGVLAAGGGDDGFELGLLGGQLVEVGVGLGVLGVDLVEPLLAPPARRRCPARPPRARSGRVEQRLLRQVADLQAGHRHGLALDLLVDAGHDLQQRALARAVDAEHADLGAGEEGQRDVLEDLPLRRHDLADAVHREDVLGHGVQQLSETGCRNAGRGAEGGQSRYCRRSGRRRRIAATVCRPQCEPCRACCWLFSLVNLVIGTGAFVIGGILRRSPATSASACPAAGQAMTAYALSTALLAPLMLVATGRWPRKQRAAAGAGAVHARQRRLCAGAEPGDAAGRARADGPGRGVHADGGRHRGGAGRAGAARQGAGASSSSASA